MRRVRNYLRLVLESNEIFKVKKPFWRVSDHAPYTRNSGVLSRKSLQRFAVFFEKLMTNNEKYAIM